MPASDGKAMTLGASEARTITANIVRLLDTKCIHLEGRMSKIAELGEEDRNAMANYGVRRQA